MSEHIPVERLSAYLDSELSEVETNALEQHVRGCASCRDELQGLRRVVNSLRSLERKLPPPALAQQIERRVAVERPAKGIVERLEAQLVRRPRIDSGLAVGFALVLALAAIVYLFAEAVDRRQQTEVPIVVPGSTSALGADEVREVADRVFRRRGDTWVEEGAGAPSRILDEGEAHVIELLAALPWLGDLLIESRAVILVDGDETLEIVASGER